MARVRLAKERVRSRALLLKRVAFRDSDLIVGLFTEERGAVTAVARGARRSTRRFTGLEPMHLLRVSFDMPAGRDMGQLTEVTLERPRLGLTTSLGLIEAAGQGLRWLRRLAPNRNAEPQLWIEINALLDALEAEPPANAPRLLAASGLRMLDASGWGLELERCVRCGRGCPPNASARVDPVSGGVVCRACGGQGALLSSAQRRAVLAAQRGDDAALATDRLDMVVIDLVEHAVSAHGQEGG